MAKRKRLRLDDKSKANTSGLQKPGHAGLRSNRIKLNEDVIRRFAAHAANCVPYYMAAHIERFSPGTVARWFDLAEEYHASEGGKKDYAIYALFAQEWNHAYYSALAQLNIENMELVRKKRNGKARGEMTQGEYRRHMALTNILKRRDRKSWSAYEPKLEREMDATGEDDVDFADGE